MINQLKKTLLAIAVVSIVAFVFPAIYAGTGVQAATKTKVKISTSSKITYVDYGFKLNMKGTKSKVTWSSSDATIASVSQSGYVYGKKEGKVTIQAKVSGKTYKCKVTVYNLAHINLYGTRNMGFTGATKSVTYKSSNTKIATVDKNGKVVAKKLGDFTITTKTNGKTYTCKMKAVAKGWVKDFNGKWYYYKDGKALQGWHYINGYKYYFYKDNCCVLDQDVADRLTKSQKDYQIHINRKQCKITIFAKDGDKGYTIPVKAMTCSVGLSSTPTPTGTFKTKDKARWGSLMNDSYGQYCTRITGSVLFHSVAGYNKTSYNLSYKDYNKLGKPASHGCVRLCVRDAKWIYDNCKLKTVVKIDDKSDGCRFDKPKTIKIKKSQHYDPTDPAVKKK